MLRRRGRYIRKDLRSTSRAAAMEVIRRGRHEMLRRRMMMRRWRRRYRLRHVLVDLRPWQISRTVVVIHDRCRSRNMLSNRRRRGGGRGGPDAEIGRRRHSQWLPVQNLLGHHRFTERRTRRGSGHYWRRIHVLAILMSGRGGDSIVLGIRLRNWWDMGNPTIRVGTRRLRRIDNLLLQHRSKGRLRISIS